MENYWYNVQAVQPPAMVPVIDMSQPHPMFFPQQMVPVPVFPQTPFPVFTNGKKNQNPAPNNRPQWNTNAREFVPQASSPSEAPRTTEVKPLPAPKELPNIPSFDWVQEGAPKILKSEGYQKKTTPVRPIEIIKKPQPVNKVDRRESSKVFENEQLLKSKSIKSEKGELSRADSKKRLDREERSSVSRFEFRNEHSQSRFDEQRMRKGSLQESETSQGSQPVIRQHRRIYFQSRHISQTRNELSLKSKAKPTRYSTASDSSRKERKSYKKPGDLESRTGPSSDESDMGMGSKKNISRNFQTKNETRANKQKVENPPKKLNVESNTGVQFSHSVPNSPKEEFSIPMKTLHKFTPKNEAKSEERLGSMEKITKRVKEPIQKLTKEMNSAKIESDKKFKPVSKDETTKTSESKSKNKQDNKTRGVFNLLG